MNKCGNQNITFYPSKMFYLSSFQLNLHIQPINQREYWIKGKEKGWQSKGVKNSDKTEFLTKNSPTYVSPI